MVKPDIDYRKYNFEEAARHFHAENFDYKIRIKCSYLTNKWLYLIITYIGYIVRNIAWFLCFGSLSIRTVHHEYLVKDLERDGDWVDRVIDRNGHVFYFSDNSFTLSDFD